MKGLNDGHCPSCGWNPPHEGFRAGRLCDHPDAGHKSFWERQPNNNRHCPGYMTKERALEAAESRLDSGHSHTFGDAVDGLPVSVEELREARQAEKEQGRSQ